MKNQKHTTNRWMAMAALVCGVLAAGVESTGANTKSAAQTCSWSTGFEYNGLSGVNATEVFNDGGGDALYIGGHFTTVDGITVNNIVRWDGTTWSALSGPSGVGLYEASWADVYDMEIWNDGSGDALYVAGRFTTAGGVTANHIAKWDGTTWSALSGPSGIGTNATVFSLEVFGGDLYVGGNFSVAGGVMATRIARWDGAEWHGVGPAATIVSSGVAALLVHGGALYVGGGISSVDGVTMNNIMRWDGSMFTNLTGPSGIGVDAAVSSLETFNDGTGDKLYVGGWFTNAGGIPANHIASWDGGTWSMLYGPSATGLEDYVSALAVYDDGTGEALYLGGNFYSAGGVVTNYIAKWDGATFSDLYGPTASGVNLPVVQTLTVYDDGSGNALFAGGGFVRAGGLLSYSFGKWSCGNHLFSDGFEQGDTTDWSITAP